ncbi:MAG: DNA-binding response regulator [Burkholderiales bacterium RIFCSPLOWO2_02_FULL_57_36]|nr:MAG: DNA-binding response regulator [Burkholderiales bacterium RIFCSPLOWO2_02_FULL_57_36]
MWSMQRLSETRPTALIVEDEPALCDELHEALRTLWPELHIVAMAQNGLEALRKITEYRPDIIFLDIQIPEPNGLDVARFIGDRCHVVFVTAYDAHAVDAFENGAVDYILKPFSDKRLAVTVQRLKKKLAHSPPDLVSLVDQLQEPGARSRHLRWITAAVGKSLRMIMIDEVVFFQSDQKYTRVALAGSEVLIKKSLKELLTGLDPEQFWQIHRSTVVNTLEISSIEPNIAGQLTVRLKNRREQLAVSESFVKRFRQM